MNSPQLQNQIDEREDPAKEPIGSSEESFLEVTLPADPVNYPGEHKVLGIYRMINSYLTSEV